MKVECPPAYRLRKYGLTQNDWLALYNAQGGRCPLCKKPFTRRRPSAVDHEHRTGEVRGLLCLPCNHALGFLHEDKNWFGAAAAYLDIPPSIRVFDAPRRHIDAPPIGA